MEVGIEVCKGFMVSMRTEWKSKGSTEKSNGDGRWGGKCDGRRTERKEIYFFYSFAIYILINYQNLVFHTGT